MYCNKIYSISAERIITRSPSNNTFDIEMQHPQPRRRQVSDQNLGIDQDRDYHEARIYSIPPEEEGQFRPYTPEELAFKNNLHAIPTDLSNLESPPLVVSSTPEIVEEK